MNKHVLTFLIVLMAFGSFAKRVVVSSASEISSNFWFAGDTIVLKNGIWTNQAISLRADGTALSPVVMMAETPGKVILNGSSKLAFAGKFIYISGLYFKDGNLSGSDVISFRTSSSSLAENCRITNISIENYNPPLNTTDSKWVSLYGENNTVSNCTFINKANSGTLLVVWLKAGTVPKHVIENNYFGYRNANLDGNGNELNGQEIIRIGDSSTSMQTANVKVTGNFFERCNGEIEIISNKSGGNYYFNNIFFECKGMLTLRHGNDCTVEGNYFIGNNVSNSGGVRIIGENHKVFNNYFENLTGTNYRSALCMVRGKENSVLNDYFQVKNAVVVFNTMVNCTQAFSINYNSGSGYTMPPVGSVIAHNHVYNTSSSKKNVVIDQNNVSAMDLSWKNNLMNQGKYSNFTYTGEQVITGIDPKLSQTDIFEPQAGSGLIPYATTEYSEITTDIKGRSRLAIKLPGASQIDGQVILKAPVREQVGASFSGMITSASLQPRLKPIKAYAVRNQFVTDVPEPGILFIYDLRGRCIYKGNIDAGISRKTISENGIFLVAYKSNCGETSSCKVFVRDN